MCSDHPAEASPVAGGCKLVVAVETQKRMDLIWGSRILKAW